MTVVGHRSTLPMVLMKIHLPLIQKLKLTPLLKITLTMTLMTRKSMMMTLMMSKDPNWNLPKGKKILLSDGNKSS